MKILIPIDGSVFSDEAVAFVTTRTALIGRDPHIVLLNVQPPLPARASRLVTAEALEDYYKEESEKAFKPARKILKKPLRFLLWNNPGLCRESRKPRRFPQVHTQRRL